jgi:type IV pilus assembly protein PilA
LLDKIPFKKRSYIIQKSKEDAVKADAIQIINSAKTYVAANGVKTPLTQADLATYIDNPSITTYSIAVAEDATTHQITYELTATKAAGNVTLTFTGATLTEIDADKDKGSRVIGD